VVPEEGELSEKLKAKGVETRVITLPPIRPWSIIDMVTSIRGFLNVIRNRRISLIYCNGSRAAFYGGMAGLISKVPVIWHCRIADPDPCLDFLLASLSTRIVVNSKATSQRFPQRFRPRITMVYNGVDISWLQDERVKKPRMIQDGWKVILVVARASRWKRHDFVLSAFEQVAESEPDAHLVCVGAEDVFEPEWWAYLQERTCSSEFSNRIHWIGKVDDVRPWYQAASVLVLASENEPFGRVLVEAMASDVSVVATRSGGIPEIVRHNQDGILVTPGNVEDLTEAIRKVLEDNRMRTRLAISGRKRSKAFSLDTHVERMVQIFDEIGASQSGKLLS